MFPGCPARDPAGNRITPAAGLARAPLAPGT